MIKTLLLTTIILLNGFTGDSIPTNKGVIVEKTRGLITVDINGQLENWYIDEDIENYNINDNVYIVGDRLVRY